MFKVPLIKFVFVFLLSLTVAGCKSDTEKADEFFQSGMELLEAGDADRAIVQFRNVFQFEVNHRATRMTLGNIYLDQNSRAAAYGQFLHVAEHNPDDFEARRNLAELAFSTSNWDEFARHGEAVVQMKPDETRVQIIDVGLKYRDAALAKDDSARRAQAAQAEALLKDMPQSAILNILLAENYSRDGRTNDVLARMDALLLLTPDDLQLQMRRLALLNQLQDLEGVETQLQDMIARFPENQEVQSLLLRFYISQQRLDEAEEFLRQLSDPADEDPATFLALVNFVSQTRGVDAARAELERAIELNPRPARFRGLVAMMDFQTGEREDAIAEMQTILEGADVAQEDIQSIKTILARMLVTTGNQVGARRHIEEVLAQNQSNVEALKMQSSWQLQADQVDQALANLRIALDTAPQDIQVMNMLYEAYQRLGDRSLANEYLALAVEASGNAPETSLRYARVLIQEERYLPAEDVLLPALRQAPQNLELLGTLGQLYLRLEDTPRATQVIDTLRRINTEQSLIDANALQTQILAQNGGTEEALAFLEGLANAENADQNGKLALLRARLQTGGTDQALEIAKNLTQEDPDNLVFKQVMAITLEAAGKLEEAQTILLEIINVEPEATNAWLRLSGVVRRLESEEAALAVLEEGLAATNDNGQLLWAKATLLERANDIDGAIGIYEKLYARDTSSVLFANNLASLLSTYKNDPESLERAWTVGRRLRDIDNPVLQDTYGWLLYRRNEFDAALPYLESAAAALDDPIVEAHLGFAYAALSRDTEALEQLQRAVDIAGPADTRTRIELARAEITRLRSLQHD